MKQSLKYYILIALAVLLHSVTMKAANTSYIIEDPDQDECFISQAAPANRNILERFHFYCTIMPCEMGHADISTTMDIYADATEDKKKEVMTNLEGKIVL